MPIVPGQVVHATIAEGRRSGWMTPMEVRGGQCHPTCAMVSRRVVVEP